MESNGIKGKIHVSQQTADELTKIGKGHWLTPREDLIEAKGKGKLQTYWVSEQGGARSMGTNSHKGPASLSECSSGEVSCCDDGDDNNNIIDNDDNVEARLAARLARGSPGRNIANIANI